MAGRVFLSYRREDTAGFAGRIHDYLSRYYPIFRDLSAIPPGANFVEELNRALHKCPALLAVIGPGWLQASHASGRRLDDPGDFVRLEIAGALRNQILVIPVLVAGARMPSKSDLPAELADLAECQAVTITDEDFESGMRRLVAAVGDKLGPPIGRRLRQAFVAAVVAFVNFGAWELSKPAAAVNPRPVAAAETASLHLRGLAPAAGGGVLAYQQLHKDDVFVDADFSSAKLSARTARMAGLPQTAGRISYLTRQSQGNPQTCRTTLQVSPGMYKPFDLALSQERTPVRTFRNVRLEAAAPLIVGIQTVSATGQGGGAGCGKLLRVGESELAVDQMPVVVEAQPSSTVTFTFAPQSDDSPAAIAAQSYPVFQFAPALAVAEVARFTAGSTGADLVWRGTRGPLRIPEIAIGESSLSVAIDGEAVQRDPQSPLPAVAALVAVADLGVLAWVLRSWLARRRRRRPAGFTGAEGTAAG